MTHSSRWQTSMAEDWSCRTGFAITKWPNSIPLGFLIRRAGESTLTVSLIDSLNTKLRRSVIVTAHHCQTNRESYVTENWCLERSWNVEGVHCLRMFSPTQPLSELVRAPGSGGGDDGSGGLLLKQRMETYQTCLFSLVHNAREGRIPMLCHHCSHAIKAHQYLPR